MLLCFDFMGTTIVGISINLFSFDPHNYYIPFPQWSKKTSQLPKPWCVPQVLGMHLIRFLFSAGESWWRQVFVSLGWMFLVCSKDPFPTSLRWLVPRSVLHYHGNKGFPPCNPEQFPWVLSLLPKREQNTCFMLLQNILFCASSLKESVYSKSMNRDAICFILFDVSILQR